MASPGDRRSPSPLSDAGAPVPEARGARDVSDVDNADTAQAQAPADDASSDHLVQEKTPKESIGKRQKVKRHCWRFKWWYPLGLIIFLAIFLPIL
jgi:hypothetical protein